MHVPVDVIFYDMNRSGALVADIEKKAQQLGELCDQIIGCQVVVESPHHRHRQGNLYRIRIQLSVPNHEFFAGQTPHDKHQHEDPFIAVNDAIDAIQRQLKDYVTGHHGDIAVHEDVPHGQIAKICLPDGPDYPERGFGFISTCDGREVYFHAKNLLDVDFQRLELGSHVNFAEEQGDGKPQATSVWLVGERLSSVS